MIQQVWIANRNPWVSTETSSDGSYLQVELLVLSDKLLQSCPTICDLMDHSPPGSSVQGILQARILEWDAISSSRRSSQPTNWTYVSEASIIWPPDTNSRFIEKDPDAGKDWSPKEKRVTEDEMVGWDHWCNRHELGQTLRGREVQGGLVWCSPWGCKESDTT